MAPRADNRPAGELFIEYALRLTKGRIRLVNVGSAALMILAFVAGYLLLVVAADHFIPGGLPIGARTVLRWVLAAAVGGMATVTLLVPWIRRINDLYVAKLIEKAHPEFRNDLTAALELADDRRVGAGVLGAIRRQAAREVGATDVERAVTTRRLRTMAIVFAAAAGALLLYAAISPKGVFPSLWRLLGDETVPVPTETRIVSVQPRSGTVVITGRPVNFAVGIEHPADPVVLRISRDGGRTFLEDDRYQMQPEGGRPGRGRYVARWPAASAGEGRQAAFRIESGDARCELHTLRVLPAPAVRKIRTVITWPKYTRLVTESDGAVEALPGSRVRIVAEASLPVAAASILFDKAPAVIMKPDDRFLTGEFEIAGDDRYRIVFKSVYESVRGESIAYDLKALKDAAPRVRLAEPVGRIELAVDETLRLSGEASDDYGIGPLTLLGRVGGEQRQVALGDYPVPGVRVRPIEVAIPVTRLGRAGETLTCRVEARDWCPPRGQAGHSEAFELVITEPARDDAAEGRTAGGTSSGDDEARAGKSGGADDPLAGAEIAAAYANAREKAIRELLEMVRKDAEPLEKIREHLGEDAGRGGPDEKGAGSAGEGESEERVPGTPGDEKESIRETPRGASETPDGKKDGVKKTPEEAREKDKTGDSSVKQTGDGAKKQPREATDDSEGKEAERQSEGNTKPDKGPRKTDQPPSKPDSGQRESIPRKAGETRTGSKPEKLVRGASGGTEGRRGLGPAPSSSGKGGESGARERADGSSGSGGTSGSSGSSDDASRPGRPRSDGAGAPVRKGGGPEGGSGGGGGTADGLTSSPGSGSGRDPRSEQRPDPDGGARTGAGSGSGAGSGTGSAGRARGGGTTGASGMHKGTAGGDPKSGSSDKRGEVKDADLAKLTPGEVRQLESIGRSLSEAQRQIRDDEVDPALLKKLGMTPQQFRGFVEKYTQRFGRLKEMPAVTVLPTKAVEGVVILPGSDGLKTGRGLDQGIRDVEGMEKLTPDQLRKLYEARAKSVSAQYRKHVEAYYRAIAESSGATETPPTAPAE